jgi:hypothetical protein
MNRTCHRGVFDILGMNVAPPALPMSYAPNIKYPSIVIINYQSQSRMDHDL